jgi:hypothetical protein|tara:strand:+ start:25753 stop:26130 length:378 start_codon:yes stop_codon:yes gene_type:complete
MKVFTMTNLNQQAGASNLGMLMTFLVIAVFLTSGLKLGPLYIDHNIVTSYTKNLIESGEIANLNTSELRRKVSDNLLVNNVRDFDVTHILMAKENNKSVVTIAYERRVELFLNLDVVAKFDTVLQ